MKSSDPIGKQFIDQICRTVIDSAKNRNEAMFAIARDATLDLEATIPNRPANGSIWVAVIAAVLNSGWQKHADLISEVLNSMSIDPSTGAIAEPREPNEMLRLAVSIQELSTSLEWVAHHAAADGYAVACQLRPDAWTGDRQ